MTLKKTYFNSKYDYIYTELIKHISLSGKVLDVGCGNLQLAKMINETTQIDVTGIDVVDIIEGKEGVKFIKYDGESIPFKDNSFNMSYAVFVLHHSKHPEKLFDEMVRVTKKRVLIFEPVYSSWFELLLLKLFDLTNLVDSLSIPLPFSFKTTTDWKDVFSKQAKEITARSLPTTFRPFEVQIFIIDLVK